MFFYERILQPDCYLLINKYCAHAAGYVSKKYEFPLLQERVRVRFNRISFPCYIILLYMKAQS